MLRIMLPVEPDFRYCSILQLLCSAWIVSRAFRPRCRSEDCMHQPIGLLHGEDYSLQQTNWLVHTIFRTTLGLKALETIHAEHVPCHRTWGRPQLERNSMYTLYGKYPSVLVLCLCTRTFACGCYCNCFTAPAQQQPASAS